MLSIHRNCSGDNMNKQQVKVPRVDTNGGRPTSNPIMTAECHVMLRCRCRDRYLVLLEPSIGSSWHFLSFKIKTKEGWELVIKDVTCGSLTIETDKFHICSVDAEVSTLNVAQCWGKFRMVSYMLWLIAVNDFCKNSSKWIWKILEQWLVV